MAPESDMTAREVALRADLGAEYYALAGMVSGADGRALGLALFVAAAMDEWGLASLQP